MKNFVGDVVILRGIPGCGKSTLASLIAGEEGVVCTADDYFYDEEGNYNFDPRKLEEAHSECLKKFSEALFHGTQIVIIANTATQQKEFRQYMNTAKHYKYRVHTVIVENRHGEEDKHGVSLDAIKRMHDRFHIQLHPDLTRE